MRVTTRERGTIPGCREAGPNYGQMGAAMRLEPWRYDEGSADRFLAKLKADHEAWQARLRQLRREE